MAWTVPSHMTLKRPYPFGNEVAQLLNEESVPTPRLPPVDEELWLLGSVRSRNPRSAE